MTSVMHKFLIYLSIYFCLTYVGLRFRPSSVAGVQFRQWLKSAGYGDSARALTPYPADLNKLKSCALRWSLYNFIPKRTIPTTENLAQNVSKGTSCRHYWKYIQCLTVWNILGPNNLASAVTLPTWIQNVPGSKLATKESPDWTVFGFINVVLAFTRMWSK
jgi:hypothetical protein